jgi:hypothetical protein
LARSKKALTPIEIGAIKNAEKEWALREEASKIWLTEREVPNIHTNIKAAAQVLLKALENLGSQGRNESQMRLLSVMRDLENRVVPLYPEYLARVDRVEDELRLIAKACDHIIGGPGAKSDHNVRYWVDIAADHWVRLGNPIPTPKGRFFQALTNVQVDHRIPKVTEGSVASALRNWTEFRNSQGNIQDE